MGIAEILALAFTAIQTVQRMQADGRAKTTAEEDAALSAAFDRATAEHNALQDGGNPTE